MASLRSLYADARDLHAFFIRAGVAFDHVPPAFRGLCAKFPGAVRRVSRPARESLPRT